MISLALDLRIGLVSLVLVGAGCAGPRGAEATTASAPPSEAQSTPVEPAPVAAAPAAEAALTFERPSHGWRAHVPRDWELLGEVEDEAPNGRLAKVVFGLPKVWSELEGEAISNAISVTAIHRFVASDERAFEIECAVSFRDMPKKAAEGSPRLAFRDFIEWDGLGYDVQTELAVHDRMGYLIEFIATPGTFAANYPLFRTFSDSLEFSEPREDE